MSRMMLDGAMKKDNMPTSQKFQADVLNGMWHDEITSAVKSDALTIHFGMALHRRHGRQRKYDIAQRTCQLARFTTAVNELYPDDGKKISLEGCIPAGRFEHVLNATEKLCSQFDDPTGRPLFGNPSLGLKLGHSLIKCAEIKKGLGLKTENKMMVDEADAFLALHKAEWTNYISALSLASLKRRRYNNPQVLPGLVKLKQFQEAEIPALKVQLQKQPTYTLWRQLLELVYSRIVIFNKRRGGETVKCLLEAFVNRPKWEQVANDALVKTLQPIEQKLLQRFFFFKNIFYAISYILDKPFYCVLCIS
jgi:hypothetical protein